MTSSDADTELQGGNDNGDGDQTPPGGDSTRNGNTNPGVDSSFTTIRLGLISTTLVSLKKKG